MEFELELPKGLKIRKQNEKCNQEAHICATYNGQLACIKPYLTDDRIGEYSVTPCSQNPNKEKGFFVELETGNVEK
jgi:hypothetical protein